VRAVLVATPDRPSVILPELKEAYARAVTARDAAAMLAHAHALLRLNPTLSNAQLINKSLPVELPNRSAVKRKVAFLRSYTIEPCVPLLTALARLHGVELEVKIGEFNSYAQDLIDPSSWLYAFEPDIVILAVQTRDIAPHLWAGQGGLSQDQAASQAAEVVSSLVSLIEPLRARSRASLIIQNLQEPSHPSDGVMDLRREAGQTEIIRTVNRGLALEARRHEGVYVLDYDALVARHGRERWTDEKKWLTSRSAVSADCLIHAAREYLRFVLPLAGRQSKVLVVDLDNTLWGGVIGEEGVHGIKIGSEYPGATFLALQRVMLNLADRGVLLAICSKNNEADAMEAFEKRSEMLLRASHFSAMRINWIDKAQNLRDIARELNVGLDSLAFIDDNPVERQRVRLELPEVQVVELPEDPAGYAAALLSSPTFERLAVTAEDRARGRYYAEQRERKQQESSAGSLEEFYASLHMRSEIVEVSPAVLARIAQLTQKTNQLNTTTKRYTESEVQSLANDPSWRLFGINVADKFGDNGLVGVVFLKIEEASVEIDTFLMSCRVIGRTVETAMLAQVCKIASSAGRSVVTGWFRPTKKNEPASQIYSTHGFEIATRDELGTLWRLDLQKRSIEKPVWIS